MKEVTDLKKIIYSIPTYFYHCALYFLQGVPVDLPAGTEADNSLTLVKEDRAKQKLDITENQQVRHHKM